MVNVGKYTMHGLFGYLPVRIQRAISNAMGVRLERTLKMSCLFTVYVFNLGKI